MDRALAIAPACTQYKVRRAESLACLGRYTEAQEAAKSVPLLNTALDKCILLTRALAGSKVA